MVLVFKVKLLNDENSHHGLIEGTCQLSGSELEMIMITSIVETAVL